MKRVHTLALLAAGVLICGCQSSISGAAGASGGAAGNQSSNQPTGGDPTKSDDGKSTKGNETVQTNSAASTAALPETMKSDAFHWFGLANSSPMKIEIDMTGQAPKIGTQTTKLKE